MTNQANMPKQAWRSWLSITGTGGVLYLLWGFVLLVILNAHALWDLIVGTTAGSVSASDISPLSDRLLNFQGKLNVPLLMIFWGFFGLAIYGFVWFLGTLASVSRQQSAEANYLQSGVVPQSSFWQSRKLANLTLLGVLVVCLVYFYVLVRVLLPWAATTFHHGLVHGQILRQVVDIAASILLISVGLYILNVSRRVLGQSWRAVKDF